MPTIMLWTTVRIHPRLTWLLFNMMKNTIANGPRDQLPISAKQAMMAEADYAFIRQHPAIMASNLDGRAEAIRPRIIILIHIINSLNLGARLTFGDEIPLFLYEMK